ncbi:MAG: iron-sulfur cluster repair di-iron protein [Candidatus Obscuribacterales bacterium]|nr:iron-sulfur cluster repair di-iron protein [Candidatus Obscuribacterales bacterium]
MSNAKAICTLCNYVYDERLGEPRQNIAPATTFATLPDEWKCPECGANKEMFQTCTCVGLTVIEKNCVAHESLRTNAVASAASITGETSLGDIVAMHPGCSCLLEEFGIDYCCGGKTTLAEACEKKGLDFDEFRWKLEVAARVNSNGERDWTQASLKELTQHILASYHNPLRLELSRIQALSEKVARMHGRKHPEMLEVQDLFARFKEEQEMHMQKEELILFPSICAIEARKETHSGGVTGLERPIDVMIREHDEAGSDLLRMRNLTNSFTPPSDACNSYKLLLHSLAQLESDMHQHVHKENNILFPRALQLYNSTKSDSQSAVQTMS